MKDFQEEDSEAIKEHGLQAKQLKASHQVIFFNIKTILLIARAGTK